MDQGSTRDRILSAAETEFSLKGFRSASLRSIAGAAGVTTGAFYGYFRSKEDVFDALVQEHYEYILGLYRQVLTEFQSLPPDEQQSSMEAHTEAAIQTMTDYIYAHMSAFRLLLCSSEGTRYEHMVDDMASMDVDATHNYRSTMETIGVPLQAVNPQLEHMLTSGMFSAYFELVIHNIPRQEADGYIEQLIAFYTAGWNKIMGL